MDPADRNNRFGRQPPSSSARPYNNGNDHNFVIYETHPGTYQTVQQQPVYHRPPPIPIPYSNREADDFENVLYNERRPASAGGRSSASQSNSSPSLFHFSPVRSSEDLHNPAQPDTATDERRFLYTPPQTGHVVVRPSRVRCTECGQEMMDHQLRDHSCQWAQHVRRSNALMATTQATRATPPPSNFSSGVGVQLQQHGMPSRSQGSQIPRHAQHIQAHAAHNRLAGTTSAPVHSTDIPGSHNQEAASRRRRSDTVVQYMATPSRPSTHRPPNDHMP